MGKDGGDDSYLVYTQPCGGLRPRLNGVEGGAGHLPLTLSDYAGDGIAGHQQGLHMMILHEAEHIPGHGHNLVLWMVPVGNMGAVPEIDQLLAWQRPLNLPDYTKAADARVQDSDGVTGMEHRHTFFCRRRVAGRHQWILPQTVGLVKTKLRGAVKFYRSAEIPFVTPPDSAPR